MKKISYSLIGLGFIATAAYAQPADDPLADLPTDTSAVAPDAPLPPAPDDAFPEPVPSDALPPAPVPNDTLPGNPTLPSDPLADAVPPGSQFTEAEIESFAAATVEVQRIDDDTTLDADTKQAQMAAAVTEAGLNPAKYNEIGQAVATDLELRAKVQTAMARHADHTDG